MKKSSNPDQTMTLTRISLDLHPPSEACLRYMAANDLDPQMRVFRAIVTERYMMDTKALRPDVANIVSLLVGPFGIVSPPGYNSFRVVELQVGNVVLDVEAELYA